MTKVFVSQFLQEGEYECAYIHLVTDLVAWLLGKKALVDALPNDVLAVDFHVPLEWQPVLLEECDVLDRVDEVLVGSDRVTVFGKSDRLTIGAEQFSFPNGALPHWTKVEITPSGVAWAIEADEDWLETYELRWEDLQG